MSMLRIIASVFAAVAAWSGPAQSQSYPSRNVVIVVPFPPGGSVDGAARHLASELSERTGKTFIVENRAQGAGGVGGSATVARADPDGYTLLFNASIHVVQPLINANVKYDVVNDFTHIALVASGALLVTTHPGVPAKTLGEFFAALKADPKRYTLATSGLGSAGHLTLEFLKQQAKVDTPIVAYRGAGPVLNDLVGGHVHLTADPMLSSLPNVQAGKLRAFAVTSAKRSSLAPDVPTIAENGLPPFEMLSWYGLWAPKGLDAAAAQFLGKEVAAVVASSVFKGKLAPVGFEPTYRDGPGLRAYIIQEMTRYKPIVEAAKIKVE